MKTTLIFSILLCFYLSAQAQFIETFSGRDLTSNHPWTGDTDYFKVTTSGELLFISPKKDNTPRSIGLTVAGGEEMTWVFDFKPGSITTGSNYFRFHLLKDPNNTPYYIQIGSTDGSIRLYRETEKQEILISSRPLVRDLRHKTYVEEYVRIVVKLEHDRWELYTNTKKEKEFTMEGHAAIDRSFHTKEINLRLETVNVKSRESIYYLDNIYVYTEAVPLPPTLSEGDKPTPLPELTDIQPITRSTLQFIFSAPVNISNATFSISDIGEAIRQQYGASDSIVNTLFEKDMKEDKEYFIRWKGVRSKDGRKVKDGDWRVRLEGEGGDNPGDTDDPASYTAGDIWINEIMADPKGLTDLSETEYIELYNTTDQPIQLTDWQLFYGERKVPITQASLPAKGFAILFREGRDIQVDEGGIKLPLPAFPASLVNTGKELTLKDPTGQIIDAATYTKATPAVSWERTANNAWYLSTDPRGGTPGSSNSTPNKEPDEKEPGKEPDDPNPNHSITIEPREVILNELLPEPNTGGSEYIELFNRSDKALPLETLAISTRRVNGELSTVYPLSISGLELLPGEYIAFTSNKEGVTDFYTAAPIQRIYEIKLPALANTFSSVVLYRKKDKVIIDEVSYSAKWHQSGVKNKKGIALERINPDESSQTPSNWTSASQHQEGGTPGYQNSQYMQDGSTTAIQIEAPEYMELSGDYLIKYGMSKAGFFCRAFVFDASGRKIEEIMNNELLATSGEISWRPRSGNLKAGVYIFLAELYHPDGDRKTIKKAFVSR